MSKRPDVLLELALTAVQRARRYLGDRTLEQYLADDQCQSAIERQLEVAGDALGQLRKIDGAMFAQIPDGDVVVAFRNVLAHGYATLDHHRVYRVAAVRAQELEAVLTRLLAGMPEDKGAG